MSEENVEVVRWAYTNCHAPRTVDVPGIEERVTPDYVFYPREGFPAQASYRLDEMVALWADLDATFTEHSFVPQRFEAIGLDHVLVTVRQTARLRGSDQWLDDTLYQLWQLASGKAQKTWTFTERAQAIRAAGVSE